MSICDKFLILGSQRSGTTLLGMTLEAHKNIELIEENNTNFHVQYALTKLINLEKFSQYHPAKGVMAGFKAPRDSHRTKEFISATPEIKLVWISRDLYQVVASMVTLRIKANTPWAIIFAPREIIKYLYTYTEDYAIAKSYSLALSFTDERKAAIALATLCWITKQRSEKHSCAIWSNHTFRINYNTLVTQPKETLIPLLEFLGLDYDSSVLDHPRLVSGARPGGSSSVRTIDTDSIDKWKSVLSAEEVDMINSIVEQVGQNTVQ